MDSKDLINIGHRAKSETEAFINRNLNDQAQGWPKTCLYGSNYAEYRQDEQVKKRKISGMLLTE
jgi:hypothetical protein